MGGGAGGGLGGCSPPFFAKFLQNLPFLSQILAFLCLQPPHVPFSPRTFKFTPPSMEQQLNNFLKDSENPKSNNADRDDLPEKVRCIVSEELSKFTESFRQKRRQM